MIGDIFQPTHLLFVLVIALLVLGPKRLPEVGKSLGRGIRDFRDAMSGEERERLNEAMTQTTVEPSPVASTAVPAAPAQATDVPPGQPAAPAQATDVPPGQPAAPAQAIGVPPVPPAPPPPPGAPPPAAPVATAAAEPAHEPAEQAH